MSNLQSFIQTFIDDVNCEDGFFLRLCDKITNHLFFIIKWAGIPFIVYLLVEFFKQ